MAEDEIFKCHLQRVDPIDRFRPPPSLTHPDPVLVGLMAWQYRHLRPARQVWDADDLVTTVTHVRRQPISLSSFSRRGEERSLRYDTGFPVLPPRMFAPFSCNVVAYAAHWSREHNLVE